MNTDQQLRHRRLPFGSSHLRVLPATILLVSILAGCTGGSEAGSAQPTLSVSTTNSLLSCNRMPGEPFADLVIFESMFTLDDGPIARLTLIDEPIENAEGGCSWSYQADRSWPDERVFLANPALARSWGDGGQDLRPSHRGPDGNYLIVLDHGPAWS